MATSFISYKDKGYWYPDSLVALVAKLLLDAIEETAAVPEWVQDYKTCLHDAAMDCRPGWQSLCLDEYILEEQHVNYMIKLLEKVTLKIRELGHVITNTELNVLTSPGYVSDLKTESIVRLLLYVKMILQGEGRTPDFKFVLYVEAAE